MRRWQLVHRVEENILYRSPTELDHADESGRAVERSKMAVILVNALAEALRAASIIAWWEERR